MDTKRRVLLQRGAGILLGAPLLTGLGAAIVTPGLRDTEVRKARADGVPVEPDDLRPNPSVAPHENAGPLLTELARQVHALPTEPVLGRAMPTGRALYEAPTALLKAPDDPAARAAFVALLRRYAPLIALAERAAALPRCDFAYDGSQGQRLVFSELTVARDAARIFAARARTASRAVDAAADIARAARLGNLMAQTPTLLHALTSASIHALAGDTLVAVAQRFGPDIAAQTTLLEALKSFGEPPDPTFCLGGEVVLARARLRERSPGDDNMGNVGAWAIVLGPLWDRQLLAYEREAFAALRATDDPRTKVAGLKRVSARWATSRAPQDTFVRLFAPDVEQALAKLLLDTQVRRALHGTALELLLRRATDGAFPARRDTPVDLYSGKPLVYRRDEKGCVLYSVGPDGADDGGTPKGKTNAPYDLVVKLSA